MANAADSVLTQLRKGVLEYCAMAYLRSEPRYGLELASRLGQHKTLLDSDGTLYPLLARLRKANLVETEWRESDSGPPRRYYRLTDQGREALATFEATWAPFHRDVDAALEAAR
ncbi:transcriptional regulator, PadR family [Quadrisphaera granulorum]|uniref:PadR family transcriptional regulator n=1 Tax=Quadrisphaera granulorum TaxID=317664 RepID=A0A316ABN4_9ACTN|nr:PadR family transcriptional regulator [Quadrisphaera granulorum]PWJ54440.1 PadR family transcriptional regulator [Quadrisphaera granulorum]SZE96212.1 transcriptional regulator, PadR family [Quadrisphaera granulorum]